MDITSVVFYIFVGISLLIYWRLPQQMQWKLLLADSLIFYFLNARPWTVLYMVISVASIYYATNYFKKINAQTVSSNRDRNARRKKCILIFTILLNGGILFVLKYTNLGIHTFNLLFGKMLHVQLAEVTWLAPLALSFYSLQLIAYLLDCYWGIAEPIQDVWKLALFTSYFPQMVSGPISRYSDIGEQLFKKHEFQYSEVVHGLKRIAWGLLKKLAVSNRAAVIVDAMWEAPETFSGIYIWIAALGFVIQLYADFSGCMDIVLGVSECFGIYLPENFNAPLFSKSIQEIWQRWHITLGHWLRDYIMNPLSKSEFMIRLGDLCKKKFGKKKGKRIPVYLSMLVLWLAMGLWHGDSWKYILGEGLWFWIVIAGGQILRETFVAWKKKLHVKEKSVWWQAFQVSRTFFLFAVGNLFFHAHSFLDALHRIALSFRTPLDFMTFKRFLKLFIASEMGERTGLLLMVISFMLMAVVDFCKYYGIEKPELFFEKHVVLRWVGYYALVLILMLSLDIHMQEIIYAQF